MVRRSKQSSGRNPFRTFREIGLNMTVTEDVLADSLWPSQSSKTFTIDWAHFFSGAKPTVEMFCSVAANSMADSDLPLASMLVGWTANIFEFQRRCEAAPMIGEVADQLGQMRRTVQRLSLLAQGGDGRHPVDPIFWLEPQADDPYSRTIEEFMIAQNRRTPSLHPILQDHIETFFANGIQELVDDDARKKALHRLEERQQELLQFFDQLAEIVKALRSAEEDCRRLGEPLGRERKKGAPGDHARDWALVRLMWIWRDALKGDPKIYLRRNRGGVELETPEPVNVMAFVVDAMVHIEPVKPHELEALEQRLIRLRRKVPETRLVEPRSRQN